MGKHGLVPFVKVMVTSEKLTTFTKSWLERGGGVPSSKWDNY